MSVSLNFRKFIDLTNLGLVDRIVLSDWNFGIIIDEFTAILNVTQHSQPNLDILKYFLN